jgi:hypothetical protein
MALERAGPQLVEAGAIDADTFAAAIAQAREPGFAVVGPLEISAWGRVPATG